CFLIILQRSNPAQMHSLVFPYLLFLSLLVRNQQNTKKILVLLDLFKEKWGILGELPKDLPSSLSSFDKQKNSNYKRELEFSLQD
ncbi:TPA: hypothetical protein ACYQT0_002507, partial [Streptococcus pneumoniae]